MINEKPWQFREIIVNDKSKVNNIDIDMTWIQGNIGERWKIENSDGGRGPDQGIVSLPKGIGLKAMDKKPVNGFVF